MLQRAALGHAHGDWERGEWGCRRRRWCCWCCRTATAAVAVAAAAAAPHLYPLIPSVPILILLVIVVVYWSGDVGRLRRG